MSGAAARYARSKIGPYVYVCRNAAGEVIYVGRSDTLYRLEFHRTKWWWPQVANVRIRKRQSYADALVLEALLIRKYLPIHNKSGVTR